MVRLKNPWTWFHGIVGAFIGGGSGAIGVAFGAMITDYATGSKFTQNPEQLLYLMFWTFLFSGIVGATQRLAKSPLPEIEETDTTIITKQTTTVTKEQSEKID